MTLIKRKFVSLLSALLEATDKKVTAYLQARVYQLVEIINMTNEKILDNCVDIFSVVRIVNDYCEGPTEDRERELKALIDKVRNC